MVCPTALALKNKSKLHTFLQVFVRSEYVSADESLMTPSVEKVNVNALFYDGFWRICHNDSDHAMKF